MRSGIIINLQVTGKTLAYAENFLPLYWEMILKAGDFDFTSAEDSLAAAIEVSDVDYILEKNEFSDAGFQDFLIWLRKFPVNIKILGLKTMFYEQRYDIGDNIAGDEAYSGKLSNLDLLNQIIDFGFEEPHSEPHNLDECIARFGVVSIDYQKGDYLKFSKIETPPKYKEKLKLTRSKRNDTFFKLLPALFVLILCVIFIVHIDVHNFQNHFLKNPFAGSFVVLFLAALTIGSFSIITQIVRLSREIHEIKVDLKKLK
ncbi:hypothetical protein [Xylocopilactobacillus apis]|uniref:Uncharacterized protein n=1 Tax=Xylocopilactobacillus apis TaxID=2932183 RepID=A0AAU9D4H3_9LACO|nr:hypothetical protein [Xylocopilactobacillus apis]BDR57386.1 hypothetical protein KIMC2_19480 [Xylocopilactobacillus apis]